MEEGERAIFNNQPVVLDALLASGRITVDMIREGMLSVAASNNSYECVRVLIKHKAKVDQASPTLGHTPLFTAARDGANEVIHILIQNGANVNHITKTERSSLHAAAFRGRVKCVEALINAKANMEAKDDEGDTPLDNAILSVNLEIIKLFVDAGCKGYSYDHWTNQFVQQRKRTKRTIIAVIGSIRRKLGRDMGNLVGSLAWEDRDNLAWERAFFLPKE